MVLSFLSAIQVTRWSFTADALSGSIGVPFALRKRAAATDLEMPFG
jgi:hypothetical protein